MFGLLWKMGVSVFDGSVGGLGGCPYSPVPAGNVPTEGILRLLGGRSEEDRINKLADVTRWLADKLGRPLPSLSTGDSPQAAVNTGSFSVVATSHSSKKGI